MKIKILWTPTALIILPSNILTKSRMLTRLFYRQQAHICVLAESCDEKQYSKLIEALCAQNNIPLIKVSDGKKLGEWSGLCKLDKEGKPRKVVNASSVAITNFGEDSEAQHVILEHFKSKA